MRSSPINHRLSHAVNRPGLRDLFVALIGACSMILNLVGELSAQDSLPPVIVSASRIPSPPGETVTSTTVIGKAEIEAKQPVSFTELLRDIPGVHIDQNGGRGGVASVYTRGADPNFTLLLVDGIQMNDPLNSRGGSFNLSDLDVAGIERIEIVRGPLASVYGSAAIGGVINIITRRGTSEPQGSVELSGGRFGYGRTALTSSGAKGMFDYGFSAAYLSDGEPVQGSAFRNGSFNGKFSIAPSDRALLQMVSHFADSHSETFPDDSGGPKYAVRRQTDRRHEQQSTLGLNFSHRPLDWLNYDLKSSFYNSVDDVKSPGVAPGVRDPFGIPPNRSNGSFQRGTFTGSTTLSLFDHLSVNLGFEELIEHGSNDSELDFGIFTLGGKFKLTRYTASPFFEARASWPFGLTLLGGVRADFPDKFSANVSPRVGAAYTIGATDTTFKANWGEGFHLPSFFALGNPIVGNSNLKPETSKSFDIGVSQSLWTKHIEVGVTYFDNRYRNLIDFDAGPPPQLVNRSNVTARGVEAELQIKPIDSLSVKSQLTYTHTDIKNSSEELRRRPQWRAGMDARWQARADLTLNVALFYVGTVLDSSIPTGDRNLNPYTRVDLSSVWSVTPKIQIAAGIDNLFNRKYEEAVGFPAAAIRPRVSLRYSF
jgi:outer membrane cobalamin receptor